MAEVLAVLGGASAALELSKVACSVAETLYTLCSNAKLIDENVRELAAELNSLGNTCAVVHNLLTSLQQEHETIEKGPDGQYSSLRECVEQQVQECKRTIDALARSIPSIQKDGTGLLTQVTLQSMNIVVSNLAPKRADHVLLDKIAALSKDVKDLKEQQKAETQHAEFSTHRSSTAVLRLSEEIITSGRKLYRESIRSGNITRSSTNATLVDVAQLHELFETLKGADDDLDNEFAYEIADATAEAAQAAFERQDWISTTAYCEELERGIKRGSFRLRPGSAVISFDLVYIHAISIFNTTEPSTAKVRLVMAIEQSAATDDQRRKSYHAQHCLAVTYVRLSQLEAANETCKSALEGRRRLLGRHDEAFLNSLALMSRIYGLQGNQFRAQIYLTMIPQSTVATITAKYQVVHSAESVDRGRDSFPVMPLVSNDVAGLGIAGLHIDESSRVVEPDAPVASRIDSIKPFTANPAQHSPRTPVDSLQPPRTDLDWSTLVSLNAARGPVIAEPETSIDEKPDHAGHGRPPVHAANTEQAISSSSTLGTTFQSHSPLLLSPPPDRNQDGMSLHRRNQSAPSGSRTVPGSPLLSSPKALEPTIALARPLGTTGLFRGINAKTRRSWLTSLNLYPSGDVEKAICKGDLMALHAAFSKDPKPRWPSTSKAGSTGHSRRRALHLAALFGDVRMAHALIIAGSDIHATVPKILVPSRHLFAQKTIYEFETALHLAIGSRQAPMVEFLVSHGASLSYVYPSLDCPTANLLDWDWLRVTQCSGYQEIIDVLQVLVNAGWDLNSPVSFSRPYRDNVVQLLIDHSNCPFDRKPILNFCLDRGFDITKVTDPGGVLETTLQQPQTVTTVK